MAIQDRYSNEKPNVRPTFEGDHSSSGGLMRLAAFTLVVTGSEPVVSGFIAYQLHMALKVAFADVLLHNGICRIRGSWAERKDRSNRKAHRP